MKCLVTFKLAPGISYEEYLEWFQQVNVPTVKRLNSITSYRVWRVDSVMEGEPPYELLEEMEITGQAEFEAELESEPAVASMLEQWSQRVTDPVIVFGAEVPQRG